MMNSKAIKSRRVAKAKKTTKSIVMHSLLAVMALVWLVPVFWLIGSSLGDFKGLNINRFFPAK